MFDDENDRTKQQQNGHDPIPPTSEPLSLVDQRGQHQRHGNLHQLRGLNTGDADIQPAGGTFAGLAKKLHRKQKNKTQCVEGHGRLLKLHCRNLGEYEHQGQGNEQIAHVANKPIGVVVGCAVDRQDTDEKDAHGGPEKRLVEPIKALLEPENNRPPAGLGLALLQAIHEGSLSAAWARIAGLGGARR